MIWKLTQRNILVYTRNRMSVFFSFLSVIIIIGLYALFLGKVQVDNVEQMMQQYGLVTDSARFLVDSWIMSGLLAINAVTLSLGALGTMVFDIEDKRFQDFIVAPASRTTVVLSYLIATWVITLVFSLIAFVLSELYILSGGGQILPPDKLLEALGVMVLTVITSSSTMFLLASFLKSGSAFGTLSTLLGTLIGFITGVYVPLGVLPSFVQKVVNVVPFSHSAALLRQIFCEQPLKEVFASVPAQGQAQAIAEYSRTFGVQLYWGDSVITVPTMLIVLAGTAVVFLILSALKLRRYKQG